MHPAIRLKALILLSVIALMAGCAGTGGKKPDQVQVLIPNSEWWETAENSPNLPTRNLAQVRHRMNDAVPIRYTLALSKQSEVNAYATRENGLTLVVFTDGFMKTFGADPDVLATTLGHELAHHKLGHTDPSRQKNRAFGQEVASQVLGSIASYFVPFSGLLVGPAIKTASLSFNRDDERDADTLGMTWALQAGYSPCGSYRLSQKLNEMGEGSALTFLSTHPGNSERMDNAEQLEKSRGHQSCEMYFDKGDLQ